MILLVTGGRTFCEATPNKPREEYMAERVALGFALDWIGPKGIIISDTPGAGRWAAIWADKRGVRCDIGMAITADAAVVFPGGDAPDDFPAYSVSVR